MIDPIVIQIIGIPGMILNALALQLNSQKKIVGMIALAMIPFVIQYLLLQAYTGMLVTLIVVLRNLTFYVLIAIGKEKKRLFFIVSYCILMAVMSVSVWEGVISILAIASKILTTIATGVKNVHAIRWINIPGSILWIIYNVINLSIAAIICESMVVVSGLSAEIRDYYKLKKVKTERFIEEN